MKTFFLMSNTPLQLLKLKNSGKNESDEQKFIINKCAVTGYIKNGFGQASIKI